jgi:hypothetical protein
VISAASALVGIAAISTGIAIAAKRFLLFNIELLQARPRASYPTYELTFNFNPWDPKELPILLTAIGVP